MATRLFALDGVQVAEVDAEADGGRTVWVVTADPGAASRPGCGTVSTHVKDHVTTRPADLLQGQDHIAVQWVKRRWECRSPSCPRKTFTESIAAVPPRCRVTARLRGHAAALVAEGGRTVTQAARECGLSWPVVHAAFAGRADPVLESARFPRWRIWGSMSTAAGGPAGGPMRAAASTCCSLIAGTRVSLTCPGIRGYWGRSRAAPLMTPRTGWPRLPRRQPHPPQPTSGYLNRPGRIAREIIADMGYEDVVMGEWEQGWHSGDKLICPDCVGDDCLKAIVANKVADGQECSFCGTSPASEFDTFMEAFMVGVNNLFEQADNAGMPWEGGYVFTTYNWYELADEFGWVTAGEHADKVLDEISDRLAEKTYASRWWAATEPDEAYSTAWKDFREQIMHRTRFVFWATKVDTDRYKGAGDVLVAGVLQAIGSLLVTFDLITTLPRGTPICRARGHTQTDDSQGWRAANLGTNLPNHSTNSTRMSPAGIPLFYGADDTDTALAEIAAADPREFFTVGQFTTTAPMTVIDLTNVPAVPSIFDPELGRWQGQLRFLNDLVEELRQPIDPDRSNLDYVPTQVFCEYFLRVFEDADIHGLAWKSAVAPGGGRCLALDVPQEDCVDTADSAADRPQLELVPGSITIHQRRTDEFRQL